MSKPSAPAGATVPIDPLARELGERFRAAGYQLYLVGGAVRDAIRTEAHTDLDLATDAVPQEPTSLN